ncbi:MAG: alpha/beta hydrolase fold domain-containing protein [Oscillospiraceae bacterium]|nr:alpha/beta hydrolase fold domain-containing protein [Oscillospiraceae bacterium]
MTPEEVAALPGSEKELSIPCGGKSVRVFEIRPDAELKSPCTLIINYHGGGYIKGRSDRDKRYCSFLTQELGCVVWDVDYCLAPEEPFPAAVTECHAVAAYAFTHAEELGFDPQRIAPAGHSAGGNLIYGAMLLDAEVKALHCKFFTQHL